MFKNEMKNPLPPVPQTECGWFDEPGRIRGAVDLRPISDDKTVLRNPHKGWFWHYIDNGLNSPIYRDNRDPDDHMEDFPGLNHLYLRFDWADVEKEEGVYDFGPLDEIMDEWTPYGYTFSLRACCFEPHFGEKYATPRYVFENGARCYTIEGKNAVQPDYGDPYFLERLEAFLKVLGEKFNNDDRIDIVDIGTYGTWGEGHTVEGDGVIYPVDVVKKHIDLHLKYFPDKPLLMNDDVIAGRIVNGSAECQEMLDYAYERGLGLQDDSICCDYYSVVNGYDTMRAGYAFRKLSENAPSCIEFAHYSYIHPEFDDYYRNGLTIVECLKNSNATYAGFHGYPRQFLASDKWLAEYCANRLGYWYFADMIVLPELVAAKHNHVKVRFTNKGWSKAYNRHTVSLALRDRNGIVKAAATEARVDGLNSGESGEFDVFFDLRGVPEGSYDVMLGVFEGDRPLNLAVKREFRDESGYYKVAERFVRGI